MIQRDDRLQAMRCTICEECLEFTRAMMRDPEQLLQMEDEFKAAHRPCEEFAEDPARARAERMFKAGMQREMRIEERGRLGRRAPRCNGRTGFGPARTVRETA